ncbi:MAG: PDZ domain-containing protein [Planctomycetota bacterium]
MRTSYRISLVQAVGFAAAFLFVGHASSAQTLVERQEEAVRAAVERIRPAVVQLQPIGGGDPLGEQGVSRPSTGLIVSDEGWVLTSSYGLDPRPEAILVTTEDGQRSTGKLLGVDHNRQLALVDAGRTLPATVNNVVKRTADVRVGETAIAVGQTFRSDQPNVAVGIVSALGRLGGRAVQTDAATSPANYGGPLLDLSGRVIGILTPLAPASAGDLGGVGWYDSGIGFAVPVDQLDDRLDRLAAGEDIHRGRAGVTFDSGLPYAATPSLLSVHPGGPAAKAGLQAGDVVCEVDGKAVKTVNDYRQLVEGRDAGETLSLVVARAEEQLTSDIQLVDELRPYEHPYLGVIAGRETGAEQPGLLVAQVLPETPAEHSGLRVGDRLLRIGDMAIDSQAAAVRQLMRAQSGEEVSLTLARDGSSTRVAAELATLQFDAFANVPAATEWKEATIAPVGSTRSHSIYTPKAVEVRMPTLLWLGGDFAGETDFVNKLATRACIVIKMASADGVSSPESERAHVTALLEQLLSNEHVDSARLVIGGSGSAASTALAIAMSSEGRFAGVVLSDWEGHIPEMDSCTPDRRLGWLLDAASSRDKALAEQLGRLGYPVHREAKEVAAWLHGLDRF